MTDRDSRKGAEIPEEIGVIAAAKQEFALTGWLPRFVDRDIEEQYLDDIFESASRTRVICFSFAALLVVLSPFTAQQTLPQSPELVSFFVRGSLLVQLPIFLLAILLSMLTTLPGRMVTHLTVILVLLIGMHSEYLRVFALNHGVDFPSSAPFMVLYLGVLVFGLPLRQTIPALVLLFFLAKGFELFRLENSPQRNLVLMIDFVMIFVCGLVGIRLDLMRREAFTRVVLTEQRAYLDQLTGLCNRWGFERDAERILRHAARERHPVTLGIIDLDHLKSLNESAGYAFGDFVLSQIGHCLSQHVRRPLDSAGRLGGAEFVLLWYAPRGEFSLDVGNQIVDSVRALSIRRPDSPDGIVTVSVGIATLCPKGKGDLDLERLMRLAYEQLHFAKSAGRNTFRMASLSD